MKLLPAVYGRHWFHVGPDLNLGRTNLEALWAGRWREITATHCLKIRLCEGKMDLQVFTTRGTLRTRWQHIHVRLFQKGDSFMDPYAPLKCCSTVRRLTSGLSAATWLS